MVNAICFLTNNPTQRLFNFATEFKKNGYDIFILYHLAPILVSGRSEKVTIIKCAIEGVLPLLSFCNFYSEKYQHVWFIRDHVWLSTKDSLSNLDTKYPGQTLLTAIEGSKFTNNFEIVRVSTSLVKDYVQDHNGETLEKYIRSGIKKYDYVVPTEIHNIGSKEESLFDLEKVELHHIYFPSTLSCENADKLREKVADVAKAGEDHFILHHFGDLCSPFIIINHCLNRRRKTLFELGSWQFNQNVHILREGEFSKIYDKTLLRLTADGDQLLLIEDFKSTLNHYGHGTNVRNTHYGISMNHDFCVEGRTVLNYDFVKNSFDTKARNFYEDIASGKPMIFLNFSSSYEKHNLLELEDLLTNKYGIKKYLVLIFVYKNDIKGSEDDFNSLFAQCNNTRSVILQQQYTGDWELGLEQKTALYREIYDKFVEAVLNWSKWGSSFRPFEQTVYYQSNCVVKT